MPMLQARLVFMGRLADVAGGPEMLVEAGALADILARLPVGLASALMGPKVRLALNGALLADPAGVALRGGDELAFLPPVSGG
jgi:molybdopterin synthase sulfur carrier subunit